MVFIFQEKRWADFPNVSFTFDCTDRPIGFYADVEHDCMVSRKLCRQFLTSKWWCWCWCVMCLQIVIVKLHLLISKQRSISHWLWSLHCCRYSTCVMRMVAEYLTCAPTRPASTRSSEFVIGTTMWTVHLLQTGENENLGEKTLLFRQQIKFMCLQVFPQRSDLQNWSTQEQHRVIQCEEEEESLEWERTWS